MLEYRVILRENGKRTSAMHTLCLNIQPVHTIVKWLAVNCNGILVDSNGFDDFWIEFDTESDYVEFVMRWL